MLSVDAAVLVRGFGSFNYNLFTAHERGRKGGPLAY
jgi:hypothetical protein